MKEERIMKFMKEGGIMQKIILLLAASLFSHPIYAQSEFHSQPELRGSPQDLRKFLYPKDKTVTISDRAEEKAYSDKAIVSLVITTKNRLLSRAISNNSSLRRKLTSFLIEAGIQQDSIKSSKFSSSPQYGWFGKKPSSYEVVNRMAISIVKEEHLKEIAIAADNHTEVGLSGTVFEHTKKDEYNHKVKSKALKKILKQKEFYEKTLGIMLTPIGINGSNIRPRATHGAMRRKEMLAKRYSSDAAKETVYPQIAQYQDRPQAPSFDEIIYEANLSVNFKIEQQPQTKPVTAAQPTIRIDLPR